MMIARELGAKALAVAEKFPVVSITGPRQSGKSTLVKSLFPQYRYVSLEDTDMRDFAKEDPRSFLSLYDSRVIIDEAQRAPEIFSYLQGVVDAKNEPGQFVLSGSQNFLLMESISQSLAGRVAVLNLLPFSGVELLRAGIVLSQMDDFLFKGCYPRVYDMDIDPVDFYPSYVQTYLERDVRRGSGILRLAEFERFLGLCAERVGEVLNKEDLARDVGVTVKTVESWLSVLEASFVALRLQPYYRNYGKRLVKSPKLYFYDTGLACSLLGFDRSEDVALSSAKGSLFEAAVVSELHKAYFAEGRKPKLYYWRDSNQQEVDLVVERGVQPWSVVEVKSSATFSPKYFKSVTELGEAMGVPVERRFVVYAGNQSFDTKFGRLLTLPDVREVLG